MLCREDGMRWAKPSTRGKWEHEPIAQTPKIAPAHPCPVQSQSAFFERADRGLPLPAAGRALGLEGRECSAWTIGGLSNGPIAVGARARRWSRSIRQRVRRTWEM
jgi:hypothetical protein